MVWVFGYGSLTWKVGFPFEEKRVGYLQGFIRRFWWWSEDHRGVPGRPGRVVNLMSTGNSSDLVYGVAYRISDDLWHSEIEAHLDHREKGGYERRTVTFRDHKDKEQEFEVIVYLGCLSNRHYTGEASSFEVAKTIHKAHGPSGANRDYFQQLVCFMKQLGVRDQHLEEVQKELEMLDQEENGPSDEEVLNNDDVEEE